MLSKIICQYTDLITFRKNYPVIIIIDMSFKTVILFFLILLEGFLVIQKK
jgi:hypothetical protein